MLRGGLGPTFLVCLALIHMRHHVLAEDSVLPVLDGHPVNVTSVAGLTAVLPCSVSFLHGNYRVIWKKNSDYLSIGKNSIKDQRMSVESPYTRDWNLHISNIREDDAGDYFCTVTTHHEQSKRVHLNIHTSPSIIEHQSSSNVVVEEGADATLTCRVTGNPFPSIRWRKLDDHSSQRLSHSGEIMQLRNVSRDHRGKYKCTADNGISPKAVWTVPLDVEFEPTVTVEKELIIASRGQVALLKCIVTANPHKYFIWKHLSLELRPDESSWKYKQEICRVEGSTRTMCLTIYDINKEDYGDYECESSNRLGTELKRIVIAEFISTTTTTTPTPSTTTVKPTDDNGGIIMHNKTTEPPYDIDKSTPSPSGNDTDGKTDEVQEGISSSIAASKFRHCWTVKYQNFCIFLVFIQHLILRL